MRGGALVVSGQWLVGKDGMGPDWAGFSENANSCKELSLIGHHAFPTHHFPLTTHRGLS